MYTTFLWCLVIKIVLQVASDDVNVQVDGLLNFGNIHGVYAANVAYKVRNYFTNFFISDVGRIMQQNEAAPIWLSGFITHKTMFLVDNI